MVVSVDGSVAACEPLTASLVGIVVGKRSIAQGLLFLTVRAIPADCGLGESKLISSGLSNAFGDLGREEANIDVDVVISAPCVDVTEVKRLKREVKVGDKCCCDGVLENYQMQAKMDSNGPNQEHEVCSPPAVLTLRCSKLVVLHESVRLPPQQSVRATQEKSGSKYWCECCKCGFSKAGAFDQHRLGQRHILNMQKRDEAWPLFCSQAPTWAEGHDSTSIDVVSAWDDSEIESFPMGSSRLDPSTMVGALSPALRGRFWRYLSDRFGKHYPEIAAIMHQVDCVTPQSLRVKELFESFEAFRVISKFITAAQAKGRVVDSIFDVACGHGLVGILLGYRFRSAQVLCVDLVRRGAFEAYMSAWGLKGDMVQGWDHPLANVKFVEADLATIGLNLTSNSIVVATHACNEANKIAVELAQAHYALWAVLPCCIPHKLYLPNCSVELGDDIRYTLMCGVFASTFCAEQVREIDRRITARQIVIAGGCDARTAVHPHNRHSCCVAQFLGLRKLLSWDSS